MATTLIKTVRFTKPGDPPEVLQVDEQPLPEPGPREARVRILATPVNPCNLLYVRGVYSGVQMHFPAPVGFEAVGVVELRSLKEISV